MRFVAGTRRKLSAVAVVVLTAMAAAPSSHALTVSTFSLAPSTTAAGGHPTVVVSTSWQNRSVKDLTLQLPPGLLGNPTAASLCDQAAFVSEGCRGTAQVGSITADVGLLGLLPLKVTGPIFNLRPIGGEPARLGFVLRALLLALPTDVLMQAPVRVRTGGDYGLDAALSNIPQSVLGIPVRITSVQLSLDASAGEDVDDPRPAGPRRRLFPQ